MICITSLISPEKTTSGISMWRTTHDAHVGKESLRLSQLDPLVDFSTDYFGSDYVVEVQRELHLLQTLGRSPINGIPLRVSP